MAAALKLPQSWGVIVSDIVPNGPADMAGLEIGDVILGIDGRVMASTRQFFGISLFRHAPGTKVTLEVLRGPERLTLAVPVVERRDDPGRFLDMVDPKKNLVPSWTCSPWTSPRASSRRSRRRASP